MTKMNRIQLDYPYLSLPAKRNERIKIDLRDEKDIEAKLEAVAPDLLQELEQFEENNRDALGTTFSSILAKKIIFQKNIIEGSTIKAGGNIHIGDVYKSSIQYPKELSLNMPTLREEEIIGRQETLRELHQMLFNNNQVVLMNGMGGIGKTTIAQVYMTKYYDNYQHILWVGQSSTDFLSDLVNTVGLKENLNITTIDKTPDQLFREILLQIKSIHTKPSLLVIDNAYAELAKYRSLLPNQPSWHILVTSRDDIPYFSKKELDFLEEAEAIALFKKYYTRKQLADSSIKILVKKVEYHTLTIEILAKTAQDWNSSAEDLLLAIEQDLEADVTVHHQQQDKIERITSYLCSIFSLTQLSEDELWLLQQFRCLPLEFHTTTLLKELIQPEVYDKEKVFYKLLSQLKAKSWLLYNEDSDSYRLHRIIFEVLQVKLDLKEELVKALILSVISELKIDQSKDNPVDKFEWVRFGKPLIQQFNQIVSNDINLLYNDLALVLQDLGDYKGAKELLEKAMASAEQNFGKDHPSTAISYSNLALVLKDLGNYAGAKELLEKAMASAEQNFGKDHPSTTIRYSNLALVLKDLGDYAGAKELLEKAMASAEQNFGKDHPSTAISYSNLALVLQGLGNYTGAKELLEKAMASAEQNFGKDHPSTAISYSNLALVLKDLGDYAGAKELLEKAMVSAEQNFGKDHPSTARSYSNLALVLQGLGDYAGAKELLEKAMASAEQNFGKDHPSTATSYSNLALVLQELGDYAGAKELLEKAMASDEQNFGKDHPSTATSYSNLALVLKNLGDYERARKLYEESYQFFSKHLGTNHPNTKIVKGNLDSLIKLMNEK